MEKKDNYPLILVVDDEPDVESLIRQRFRKSKYNFLFSHNGEHALSSLSSIKNIDLVISDINMPVMDGLTLLAELKNEYPLVKTIIVSAYDDMTNIREAMNKGAFDFITKPIDFTDLEVTLNKSLKYVQELRQSVLSLQENNIMRMFVDDNALSYMLAKMQDKTLNSSEYIEASIVFVDICGFTSLSENNEPRNILSLLQTYFDFIVQIILNNNGRIDKFIGDAVMATFTSQNHQKDAASACLEIRQAIAANDKDLIAGDLDFKPNVSIGLNSGTVLCGPVGSRRLNRYDFTVIGDSVNVAARLQSLANPGEILTTKSFASHLSEEFKFIEFGQKQLKGRQGEIDVVKLLSR